MNGYGGQGGQGYGQQIVTPEQLGQALQAFDVLQRRQQAQEDIRRGGNPFAQLGAALGGLISSKFGKHKGQSLSGLEQQIENYHNTQKQKMEAAAAERKRKTMLEDERRKHGYDLEKIERKASLPTTMQRNLADPVSRAHMEAQLKKSNASTVNINSGEVSSEFQKKMAGKNAEKFNEWENAAWSANETMGNINQLRQISQLQDTGRLNEAQAMVGQIFGTEAAANMQAYQSISSNMVLQQAEKLKGAMSDGDIKLLRETMPSFGNDPRANEVVYNVLEQASQRAIDRYKGAASHVEKHGKLQGFKPEFSFVHANGSQEQSQQPQQSKSIGGKEYVMIDGQWYEK